MILGIDPGLDGGLALLGTNPTQLHVIPTIGTSKKGQRVIDETALRTLLEDIQIRSKRESSSLFAFVEKVHAMPKQGVTSTFSFGCGYGLLRGILCGLCIPYRLVMPKEWQRVVLEGLNRKQPKVAAADYVSRAWPLLDFKATPRCTTRHSGLVDAVCIAEYGLRVMGTKPPPWE